jgi:preprotein translocase subunit SecE
MFSRLIDYIKGVKLELKSVSWPTRKQTINFTLLVIGLSLATAIFLGVFDALFSFLLKKFILS